jgi:uncharacterized membrane protein YidH (DUF202 family)
MKEQKKAPATAPAPAATTGNLFSKDNYIWMIAGIVLVVVGILLMSGGKSPDPNVFKDNEVYSFRRITLAPILILIGLGIEVYAIFKKPKA